MPLEGMQPLKKLSFVPLIIKIKEGSLDDDDAIDRVVQDVQKFVNRLWRRYHDGENFYSPFALNDIQDVNDIKDRLLPTVTKYMGVCVCRSIKRN